MAEEERQQREVQRADIMFGEKAEFCSRRKRKMKSAVASFVISVSYVVSFLPIASRLLSICLKDNKDPLILKDINIYVVISHFSPLLDPLIYLFTISEFRKDTCGS